MVKSFFVRCALCDTCILSTRAFALIPDSIFTLVNRLNKPRFTDHRFIRTSLSLLKNKYLIFTAIILAWLIFFDRYNIRTRISDTRKRNKMEEDRDYYKAKAEEARKSYNELFSSPAQLEKFAREKYYMKKDNEDVFIVEE